MISCCYSLLLMLLQFQERTGSSTRCNSCMRTQIHRLSVLNIRFLHLYDDVKLLSVLSSLRMCMCGCASWEQLGSFQVVSRGDRNGWIFTYTVHMHQLCFAPLRIQREGGGASVALCMRSYGG